MKLLFVHDIKSLLYGGDVFARSYGPEIWQRYLKTFSEIKVCTRSQKGTAESICGIDKLNGPNVSFDSRIGMFKGPDAFFSRNIHEIIREDITNTDGIVIRLDSFLGLVAVRECKRQNKPYLIECVGCAWDSFWNHGLAGKILAPFIFLQTKIAIKNAPFVIYVTKSFLQRRYPTNGLNVNISNVALPKIDDSILYNRLDYIDKNIGRVKHLMTVANVGVRYKGFQFVIQALGEIKRKTGCCKYVYHIVGEGSQTYLKNQAIFAGVIENVVFHGAIAHKDVFELMKKEIDIYIQPSLQEGLPRAMIEAMSCALPCIGSDVAGIPELVQSEFIYRRSKNMPRQIAAILMALDETKMKKSACFNFENSKNYASDVLAKRRTDFLNIYKARL